MTQKEKAALLVRAELDVREQAVAVALAEQREKVAELETKRARIGLERAVAYVGFVRSQA